MEEQKRNPAAGLSESEQVQVRRQKLADLQAAGNDPFTLTKFPQDAYSACLLYTSPSPRDGLLSRMPSSA